MTKKVERTPDPVIAQVPWGAAPIDQDTRDRQNSYVAPEDDLANAFENTPDFVATGTEQLPEATRSAMGATIQPPPSQAKIDAAFSGQPVKQSSPFAPKPKAPVEAKPEPFEMGDAPSWGDLVRFVQKHGNIIIQVRHPRPLGECVDTLWRGVTTFAHPTCQLRHKDLGWIDWQDAQYE